MEPFSSVFSESPDSPMEPPVAVPVKKPAEKGGRVRFSSESSSDDGDPSIPVQIHDRGLSTAAIPVMAMPRVSSNLSLANAAPLPPMKSTAVLATPHLTHEQLKYKRVAERKATAVAPPSRPDAPDTDDSLRRISVVILQHINRGERAALGLNVAESSPRHAKAGATEELGGFSGLMQRFAAFAQLKETQHEPSSIQEAPRKVSTVRERFDSDDDDVDDLGRPLVDPVPVLPSTPEELYDAEVEDDEFHEARYLRPEYEIVQSFGGFFCLFPETAVQRVRYTFSVPNSADIYDFMKALFNKAKLTAESSIISLVYIERLMEQGRLLVRAHNWRPIVLCGLLLASKVWDDLNSWSVEFAAIYPQYTVHAINLMERLFVSKIGFNLFISSSVYARYYFALRALNEQKSFRQRYNNMVTGPGAPVAIVKRIEQSTKELRESIYSRSM